MRTFILRPRGAVEKLGVDLAYVSMDRARRAVHQQEWESNLNRDSGVVDLERWRSDQNLPPTPINQSLERTASGAMMVQVTEDGQELLESLPDNIEVFSDGPLSLLRSVHDGVVQPSLDLADAGHLRALGVLDAAGARRGATGQGVVAAIIDSGIDTDHPAIKGRMRSEYVVQAGLLQYQKGRGDLLNHGTSVASLVSGGPCGVAPDVELININVFAGQELLRSDMVSALGWLRRQPEVALANISAGFVGGVDRLLAEEVSALVRIGMIPVAAVGNSGAQTFSPGNTRDVISVGACEFLTTPEVVPMWSSRASHGPAHDPYSVPRFLAPGVGVWCAVPGGGFMQRDGTSFAAPLVTGIAALLLEKHKRMIPVGEMLVLLADSCRVLDGVKTLAQGMGLVQALG
ncbi:MAG: S8 family serine peptidase [Polyangiales bacterium]